MVADVKLQHQIWFGIWGKRTMDRVVMLSTRTQPSKSMVATGISAGEITRHGHWREESVYSSNARDTNKFNNLAVMIQ
jgi:hypothetical protein